MNNKRVCRQGAWALMVVLSACACAAEGPIVTNGGFEDVKDGKTVGEAVSISEGTQSYNSTYRNVNLYMEEAAMDSASAEKVNVQPGQQEISAPVTVTYLLK